MTPAQILCIGVNHQTAPLAIRDTIACAPTVIAPEIGEQCPHIDEWAVLSTCNRVEIYVAVSQELPPDASRELLLTHFAELGDDVLPYMYVYKNQEAIDHLLHVTSGLNSLVLGEPQILGQVNRAFRQAQEQKTSGPVLRALFRAALATGKRVRSETGIGRNPASVPSVAINQAKLALGTLSGRTILLVGAGAMARTAVKALRARNHELINIANRTRAHADALVEPWGGAVYGLDELDKALLEADIAFFATHARQPLLTRAMLQGVMARRPERPLMLFDLSAPRNIETAVENLPGVALVDMDRLQAELDESLIARRLEIPAAEAIIAEETAILNERLAQLAVRPVIAGLHQKAEAIRRREVARTMRHLGEVDQEMAAHIDQLSHALVNQLLHEPTIRLRHEANGVRTDTVSEIVRELFNLE